jgi:hypothetical protein
MDALYECCSILTDGDALHDGWPSSLMAFRWNGRLTKPGQHKDSNVPMPAVAFILFMVFNIASILGVRARVYKYSPEKFYTAAQYFAKECFSQTRLSSIQAVVMLMLHSLLTPSEANLWTLIHVAMAHCVELGIHRDDPQCEENAWDYLQIKRYIFFCIYSLDR